MWIFYALITMEPCRDPYILLECVQDESLQLAQTLVDARTSPLFHDRFGRLEGGKKKKNNLKMTVSTFKQL